MKTSTKLIFAAAATALAARWVAGRKRWPGLRGRVVLITGGSRGLGLALARECARRGARVAICARDQDELSRAKEDVERRGGRVVALTCDVTDDAQAKDLVREVERRLGPIEVVINNAGAIQVGPMDVMTREDYEGAMDVHFWGPLNVTLAALPAMRARGSGRIVNIASIGGKIAVPHLLPYTASKFALVGLSEGLRAELAGDGVYVTTVCPGLMRTGSPVHAFFKGRHRAEYAWFSVSDSLPFVTISAERAARRVVEACLAGEAEVVLTLPGKAAAAVHGLFPGATASALSLFDRLLPGPGGIGEDARSGAESESRASRVLVTRLGRRAQAENNESDAR